MRYFIEDHANADLDDVVDALAMNGFRHSVRNGVRHDYDLAEAHHVQALSPMTVHTFAAEIDLTEG